MAALTSQHLAAAGQVGQHPAQADQLVGLGQQLEQALARQLDVGGGDVGQVAGLLDALEAAWAALGGVGAGDHHGGQLVGDPALASCSRPAASSADGSVPTTGSLRGDQVGLLLDPVDEPAPLDAADEDA